MYLRFHTYYNIVVLDMRGYMKVDRKYKRDDRGITVKDSRGLYSYNTTENIDSSKTTATISVILSISIELIRYIMYVLNVLICIRYNN